MGTTVSYKWCLEGLILLYFLVPYLGWIKPFDGLGVAHAWCALRMKWKITLCSEMSTHCFGVMFISNVCLIWFTICHFASRGVGWVFFLAFLRFSALFKLLVVPIYSCYLFSWARYTFLTFSLLTPFLLFLLCWILLVLWLTFLCVQMALGIFSLLPHLSY